MGLLDRGKLVAEIAKLGSEIYATVVDKSRALRDKDARIAALEAERDTLKRKLEGHA